jgi:2-polyprenyl-3-methyl-5-hydroxy-6-metoxy-1,4-benzoquinol methylase
MSENLQYTLVDGIKCFSPEVASDYADYPDSGFDLTEKNAESSFWVSSRNRLFKNIVFKYMAPAGKTKLLEIGCGTGNFISQIVANEKLQITGSEVYLKGLFYAKKNLPSVDFIQFDVTRGKFDEQFDMITAFDVIEHVEEDVVALTNVNQLLRSGGFFIVTVPQHMLLWGKLDEIVKHKRRYSRQELVTKLKQSGFEIKYCTSFLFILFPLMLISRLLDKGHSQPQSDEVALEKRVKFSNGLNWILDRFMRVDEALIKAGFSLPFGGTLLIVARKP